MDLATMSADSKSRESSSSRSLSRKAKNGNGAKKQPQRGLGVAQLEKLRLQEQHGKQQLDHFAFSDQVASPQLRSIDGSISSLRQSQRSSMLPMQHHHHHHHHQQLLFVHHGQQQGHRLLLPQKLVDNRQEKGIYSKDDLSASSFCFDSGIPKGISHQDLIRAPPGQEGTYGFSPPPFLDAAASMPADLSCRQQQMGFRRTPSPSKQKELSSFQNENHRLWTSDDNKAYERKRPRLELWLRPKVVLPPNNLSAHPDVHCYTSGVPGGAAAVSNALGSQVEEPVMLAKWLESDGYQLPEKTVTGTSLNDSSTPSTTTTLVNSCSSASSPSCKAIQTPRQVNGRTARSTSPSEMEIESTRLSDFLALGFSNPTKDEDNDSSNSSKDYLTSNFQQEDNGQEAAPAARAQMQWMCINRATDGCYQTTTAKRYAADVSLDLNLRLSI